MKSSSSVLLLAVFSVAGPAAGAPMTYIITGTGSGYLNTQPFTDAPFYFVFSGDTTGIVHGTTCCAAADSTMGGTLAAVAVQGFHAAGLTGDDAVFMNHATNTAGIWHFNSPEFLTVAAPIFGTATMADAIPPTTGTVFSYSTPILLALKGEADGSLYFTSVHDVHYSQEQRKSTGIMTAESVTPASGAVARQTPVNYSFVVSHTESSVFIAGMDVLIQDNPANPYACWLYYDLASDSIEANYQGNWSAPVKLGSAATVTGNACTIDALHAAHSINNYDLSLMLPVTFTVSDGNTWPIYLFGFDTDNDYSGYQLVGSVTVE